jgi:8-oxo-dGTP diphosphatase
MAEYPHPILTVDVITLMLSEGELRLGVMTRPDDPFGGQRALPGGYVHADEDADTEATARRILRTKAALTGCFCEQLGTFSGPNRDPRGWSATVVYYALARHSPEGQAGFDWVLATDPGKLAFDHNRLVEAALQRLRAKGSWSNLPAFFLPPSFTLSELRRTYELVLGSALNDSAFRRKIDELDLIEPLAGQKSKATARPAQLFRLKDETLRGFDRHI